MWSRGGFGGGDVARVNPLGCWAVGALALAVGLWEQGTTCRFMEGVPRSLSFGTEARRHKFGQRLANADSRSGLTVWQSASTPQ